MASREPAHGRAIRDLSGTVIGWGWLDDGGVHVRDDRHGLETYHPGDGWAIAELVCRRRVRHYTRSAAMTETQILALAAEIVTLAEELGEQRDPVRLAAISVRAAELHAESERLHRRLREQMRMACA